MRSLDFGIVAGLAILVLLCASLPYMSIVGMNEAGQNANWLRKDLTHEETQNFAVRVLKHIMLLSAKQETSRLLGEDAENRQARQMIMRRRSTEQLKRSHLKTDRCKIER